MAKFHNLKISKRIQETADAVSLSFEIPSNLKEEFKYKQGQYITFRINVNGQELRRSYSICSNPYSGEQLKVAIKKVRDGRGSVYLNDSVKEGSELEVMAPMGGFYTELNPSNKKNYYLFAGGSGITPMLSIIKSVLQIELNSNIVLFYGNLNEDSIIFRKELSDLAGEKLNIVDVLEKPADSNFPKERMGIMDVNMLTSLLNTYVDFNLDAEFFICGPTPMMQNAEKLLKERAKEKNRVHLEYFSTPDLPPAAEKSNVASDFPVDSEALVICDGDEKTITIKAGKNILDVALDANIDAPYACQGGSCCTCRALLVEGKVKMKINFALSEEEVAEGYILTCQSLPLTPRIVVDYDRGR